MSKQESGRIYIESLNDKACTIVSFQAMINPMLGWTVIDESIWNRFSFSIEIYYTITMEYQLKYTS
jgi:hypothetical protein